MDSAKPTDSLSEAKQKIASYCAYQERCQQEVRTKLYSYGLYRDQVDELMAWLITENFLNEERFAQTYAGGKFRVKKWGRFKITQALKQKDISDYCIKKGMQEIDEEDYLITIKQLVDKKIKELAPKTPNPFQLKNKISKYIISKGFEPDLVWSVLKEIDAS